jgi:hypothetical protein
MAVPGHGLPCSKGLLFLQSVIALLIAPSANHKQAPVIQMEFQTPILPVVVPAPISVVPSYVLAVPSRIADSPKLILSHSDRSQVLLVKLGCPVKYMFLFL